MNVERRWEKKTLEIRHTHAETADKTQPSDLQVPFARPRSQSASRFLWAVVWRRLRCGSPLPCGTDADDWRPRTTAIPAVFGQPRFGARDNDAAYCQVSQGARSRRNLGGLGPSFTFEEAPSRARLAIPSTHRAVPGQRSLSSAPRYAGLPCEYSPACSLPHRERRTVAGISVGASLEKHQRLVAEWLNCEPVNGNGLAGPPAANGQRNNESVGVSAAVYRLDKLGERLRVQIV